MKTIEFDTHFYKKLWTLMVPIMVQNLMLALVAVWILRWVNIGFRG